jgi:Uma2 family endonuclease
MAASINSLITVNDLVAIPEDGKRYELIEGQLFCSGILDLSHQRVAGNFLYFIWEFLRENPIGKVIMGPGLIFSEISSVIPDLVFFEREREKQITSEDYLVAAPELVIEVLSPGRENVSRDRVAKRQLYAKHAVNEYWIVDAENRAVEIYRLTSERLELAATLKDQDEITSPLLPGFTCPLANVFKR